MALSDIYKQARLFVRTRLLTDPRSLVAAIVVSAAVLWQLIVPLVANTSCGLIVPHEHIVIGQADDRDLEGHQSAEAACVAGKPSNPDKQSADLQGRKGLVLNVIRMIANALVHIINVANITALLPSSVQLQMFDGLYVGLDSRQVLSQSVAIPPPIPPPVYA